MLTVRVGLRLPADPLADGIYEALRGRPPFRGATSVETLELVRKQEPVPPRRLQPKAPRNAGVLYLRGLLRAWKGDHDLAIADCAKLIELNPKHSRAHNVRGWVYFNKTICRKRSRTMNTPSRRNAIHFGGSLGTLSFISHRKCAAVFRRVRY